MKRLEDILDLPPLGESQTNDDETTDDVEVDVEEARTILRDADNAIDKINVALPTVDDINTSDAELDEIANLAKEKFEDLVELGMNVEPRNSGPILQAASSLLGHALNAKMAKMNKKLQMVDLQLKKARLDHTINSSKKEEEEGEVVDGKGVILNRNDLLKQIIAENKKTGS